MFIVCGEALMDVYVRGDTPTGALLDARVGGSPFNTAVGLARLGQPVSLLAAVSRDALGERLVTALQAEGVGTALIERHHARTTLSVVGLDTMRVPTYAFYGEGGADRLLSPAALDIVPGDAVALHVGSLAMVVEPIASTLRILIEHLHGRTPIVYDPNVRLAVEPRLHKWREALEWMLPRAQLVKISDEDLDLVYPGTSDDAFAARVLGAGAALVVVTRGAEGACAWSATSTASVGTVSVEVVDTVGAGDSFEAALLAWLAEHGSLAEPAMRALTETDLGAALAFASRAAAITCSRRGADLPRRAEVAEP